MATLDLFSSATGRSRFDAAYKALLETWVSPPTSVFVETSFGTTHLLVSGPKTGAPLLMLPGAQGTAAMWGATQGALAPNRRTYAVDLIDQVGRSSATRILTSAEDSSLWLSQVLDGLGHDQVDLAGNSMGAFIAASFNLRHPDAVRNLILMAPAATVADVGVGYILQVLFAMGSPFTSSKRRFLQRTSNHKIETSDPLFNVLETAMIESRVVSKLIPRALTESELSSLSSKLLLILGEADTVNKLKAADVVTRMQSIKPDATCEVLSGAGHFWSQQAFRQAGELAEAYLS